MWDAGESGVARLAPLADGKDVDIEPLTGHIAADVIFRTMFSIPIEDRIAAGVFQAFRDHQNAQPMVNLGALLPLPRWARLHSRRTRSSASRIRDLIRKLVADRAALIAAQRAPADLATRIMTTPDPQTGAVFTVAEMIDEVATFFLAGHETAASALAWALFLLAENPDWQDRLAAEAEQNLLPDFTTVKALPLSRAVFRETLRLYPPVAMTTDPDGFDPGRWETENGRNCMRDAYIPFSAGARACPGAGFAMIEGPLLLSMLLRAYRLAPGPERPVPIMRLTLRGRNGIRLRLLPRRMST
jgi:cytochrome P450